MGYALNIVVSCASNQAGQGIFTVTTSYTPTGVGTPEVGTELILRDANGTALDRQPTTRSATNTFGQLPDGAFTVEWVETDSQELLALSGNSIYCGAAGAPTLVLDFATPTNATATAAGAITAQASGGTAPLTFAIIELRLTMSATAGQPVRVPNIPPGTYTVRFADSTRPAQVVDATVTVTAYVPTPVSGCTDPAADNYDPTATVENGSCTYTPPVRVPYFDMPVMQSLRFVVPGSTVRPAFDNVLLADEAPLDYSNPGYCQKVAWSDTLVLQCLSNYQGAPLLELRRASDNGVVRTIAGVRVQQGAGVTASFEAYFKADPTAGRTRAYFNEESLPLPFQPGQRITISATGTSLDGTYPIRDVLEDAAAAVPYLTVTQAFPGVIRLDGSVSTTYTVQQYDTWQFVVDFDGIPADCYYARVYAVDADFGTGIAISEPIDVAPAHRNTLLLTYRNFDNAFGLNYSAGLVNRLRVVGRFFERKATTEKTALREDDSTLDLLSASAYRTTELEVLLEPGWRHEQLAVVFCHDYVKVNTERVTLAGEYSHEPVQRYTLARGTATLELRNFLGAGNRDDYGDVDGGGPFLLANERLLKVNI